MKTFIYTLASSLLFLTACTVDQKNQTAGADTSIAKEVAAATTAKNSSTDAVVSAYLKLKNALAIDDDKAAAAAGQEMVSAFVDFDKAGLTADQLKTYTDLEIDAKEHGAHISDNIGNIAHQREHLDMLSKDIYDLVKLLGASQPLYVDHCPMYNDNKGAIWIAEVKDIKNPYFGSKMSTCGTLREELK